MLHYERITDFHPVYAYYLKIKARHIGEAMIQFMLPLMNPNKDITVTTYREGVPEGIAARAFYQKLGFRPGRLTEEFGSPVQEFVLKRCAH